MGFELAAKIDDRPQARCYVHERAAAKTALNWVDYICAPMGFELVT
jgi:hypothetical protein